MSRRALIEKNPIERDFECFLILGKKAQGKSTLMRDLIDQFLKIYQTAWSKPIIPKVFAHALSDSGAFRDIPDIGRIAEKCGFESNMQVLMNCNKAGNNRFWRKTNALKAICREEHEIKELHQTLSQHFRFGLVMFDEWTVYAKANPAGWAVDIAFNHRNYYMDALFACHKLMAVPRKMSSADVFSKIIIFKTGEYQPKENEFLRFSCAPLLERAFYVVRDAPEIAKVVQYHCIIDTTLDKIFEWNYKTGKYQELKGKPVYK